MKFKLDRSKISIIALASIGILLIALNGIFGKLSVEDSDEQRRYTDIDFYTGYLEKRISDLCQSIDGITDATVFLTLDCSNEYVYSEDNASDVLILSGNSGEQAVLLYEIYPRVRGVAVVCTGGDLPRIRETVTELLAASLGLPSSKIKVAGG